MNKYKWITQYAQARIIYPKPVFDALPGGEDLSKWQFGRITFEPECYFIDFWEGTLVNANGAEWARCGAMVQVTSQMVLISPFFSPSDYTRIITTPRVYMSLDKDMNPLYYILEGWDGNIFMRNQECRAVNIAHPVMRVITGELEVK